MAIPCRGENWQYRTDDPHAGCAEDWCLQDKNTWAPGYQQEKYDPADREQVRRAYLQAELELKEQTEANSYMGVRGALNSLKRIKKHWDEVK